MRESREYCENDFDYKKNYLFRFVYTSTCYIAGCI